MWPRGCAAACATNGIETRGGQVSATCSVGAVWLPQAASTSQEAMLRAEQALDQRPRQWPRRLCRLCSITQRETARLRHDADRRRGDAGAEGKSAAPGLSAHHPGAESRKVTHYECLLRMVRPDGEIVTAGYFVPAAEQMGIVHLMDRFALETAVGRLKAHHARHAWRQCFGHRGGRSRLAAKLCRLCPRRTGDVADRLIVELTETAALHHFEENAHFVSQLRELGVRVAIDDFGAGYTSFRNLQMLHVDTVKIDGSYVKDLSQSPENQVFVRTLVGLAKNFDMKTVAEWVGSDARRRPAAELRRGLFPGLPFRRAGSRSPLGSITFL